MLLSLSDHSSDEVWSSLQVSSCQLGLGEPLQKLLEHSSDGPEEEEEEAKEEEEAPVFTVHRYEQPACLPLGLDDSHIHT